ncbi:MAG: lysylphosphatidylglycerol synthase transmembrane domain-containing protein [Anaerolineae bacterium]
MRSRVRLILSLFLSLLFLYLAMRGIDWVQLLELFSTASYGYLALAFLLIVVISWVRALRWHLLTRRDSGINLRTLFHLVNIGYFFNNVLPAKAGEVVRGYLAGRRLTGRYGQAASSLLVERLLDVLAVVVILLLLLPVISIPEWVRSGGLVFGAIAIAGTVTLLIIARVGVRAVEWVWRWAGRLPIVGRPAVKSAFTELVSGFGVLLNWRILVPVLMTTAGVWLGYATLNYLMLFVFRMSYLPFAAAALVLCATGFSMMLPSSPGAMGVFEWAGVQGLLVYSVEQSAAFGYMLGLHLFTNLVLILLGGIGMVSQGITYAHVKEVVAAGGAATDVASEP